MLLFNESSNMTPKIILVFVACIVACQASIAPIWMAPTNLNYSNLDSNFDFNADLFENFTANLGEWATIEVATGARGNRPLSVMDSKGIIWILAGAIDMPGNVFFTAVWNFNPKTDQYRYVWKTNNSSPFVARDAGELRVPATSNHPGAMAYGTAAIDKDDNIWMCTYEVAGELWMFNTTSWMFVRQFGDSNVNDQPSRGATPYQPGEDVWPGYSEGHCLVIDSQNDLWILSGYNNNGVTSSVWHFNVTSFLWTFIAGSIKAISADRNTTFYGGGHSNGCDIDENDRVWIYGGSGLTSTSQDAYGDLWTFDTRTKRQWEFEYGENTFAVGPVVVSEDYNAGNRPPAANTPVLIDRRDGTLMLAPSSSYDANGNLGGSDTVWQYSKSLKQWKLVYGNITAALDQPGNYTNFRAAGSAMPGLVYVARANGKHTNGDLYLIGGSLGPFSTYVPNRKDIWLIPQDQCVNNIHTCDTNADCIEEMFGYSCKCKEGFTGDGFTCTAIPVTQPVADAPMSSSAPSTVPTTTKTPSQKTSDASLVGASFVGTLAVALAFINL